MVGRGSESGNVALCVLYEGSCLTRKDCPKHVELILISNFRRVLNVVYFVLGDSPASKFYMPTFRKTLFHFHRKVDACRMN